jgi:hypothetical protein
MKVNLVGERVAIVAQVAGSATIMRLLRLFFLLEYSLPVLVSTSSNWKMTASIDRCFLRSALQLPRGKTSKEATALTG